MLVKDVLTEIRKFTYSAEYLQGRVNSQLAEYFEEDLGSAVATLKNNFDFPENDVYVEGAAIRFPGGRYWIQYEADDKKSGRLIRYATFENTWFDDPGEIADVLKALELSPTTVQFEMKNDLNLKGVIPGIRAMGWTLTSQLEHKAEFSQGAFRLAIENDTLTFHGFMPSEMFGNADSKQSKLAGGVLALLGSPKKTGY
jgi:hypothetical protein